MLYSCEGGKVGATLDFHICSMWRHRKGTSCDCELGYYYFLNCRYFNERVHVVNDHLVYLSSGLHLHLGLKIHVHWNLCMAFKSLTHV